VITGLALLLADPFGLDPLPFLLRSSGNLGRHRLLELCFLLGLRRIGLRVRVRGRFR
jgi:hypothetical protein